MKRRQTNGPNKVSKLVTQKLPDDVLANIGEYLPIRQCYKLRILNSAWNVAMRIATHAQHDQILNSLKTNEFENKRVVSARLREPSSYQYYENTDDDDEERYVSMDIHTTCFADTASFKIAKKSKMSDQEFEQFKNLNEMQEGHIREFDPTIEGFVINLTDRSVDVDYYGEIENDNMRQELKDDDWKSLFSLLCSINSMSRNVITSEINQPFNEDGFEYQLYFLMEDFVVWEMKLNTKTTSSRYSSYNE
jgi:hypothetical protein